MMLDGPCSYHTPNPSRPANHSTRQCSWYQWILRDSPADNPYLSPLLRAAPRTAPRAAPLTGVNTVPVRVRTPPRDTDNRRRPENVNQVASRANNNNPNTNNNDAGPSRQNDYREHHQSYMVFVTEPMDNQSQHRRDMEVNAVMPAVPRYLN